MRYMLVQLVQVKMVSHDLSLSGTIVAAYLLYFNLHAFQGLAALCEKEDDPQFKAELPEVYTKLLHMYKRYSVHTVYDSTGRLIFYFHAFYAEC